LEMMELSTYVLNSVSTELQDPQKWDDKIKGLLSALGTTLWTY
jgi:hypothetical protein